MTLSEKFPSRLLAILASTLLLTAQAAIAATINVTTEADVVGADGKCSLREAISNVNAHAATVAGSGECAAGNGVNDVILLPAGTYALSIGAAGENNNAGGDFDIRASVAIEGAGIGKTIIDGNHIDRIFDIPVDGLTVSMQDISIRNGLLPGHRTSAPASVDGGAIFVGADTLGLLRVELSSNQAGAGSLSNTSYNYGGDGGALYASLSTLTIIDCVFDGNVSGAGETIATSDGSGGQGGAMYLLGGSATVTHSSFTNNGTQDASGPGAEAGYGGAIYVSSSDSLAIAQSAFDSNQAGPTAGKRSPGGALLALDTGNVVSITQTSITRNSASFGGGIAAGGGAGFTIVNSTIADNQADTQGGGIFFNSVIAHIDFTTITKNDSAGGSGIVANDTYTSLPMTTINLRNSIVSGNTGGSNGCTFDGASDFVSQGYNIAGGGCPSDGTGDVATSSPKLAPLAANGGLGMTHAPLVTSPALDGGSCAASSLYVDQRGIVRPIDDARATNAADGCDIGAVELNDEIFSSGFD